MKHVKRSAQLATWSIEAQEKLWNKTGGTTPWMASTASAGALKSGESGTTPPIIALLHNITNLGNTASTKLRNFSYE